MNRGHVLQNSPVQQMMATGNPSWWNINNLMRPPLISSPHHLHHLQQQSLLSTPSSSSSTNLLAPPPNNNTTNNTHNDNDNNNVFHQAHYNMNMTTPAPSSSWLNDHSNHHQEQHQQVPESWSQLLLGGVYLGEEAKKMENNWEEQVVVLQQQAQHPHLIDVKQESSVNSYNSNNNNNNVYSTTHDQEFQLAAAVKAANWSHHHQLNNIPVSSPQSCVTSFSSNNMLDFSSSISSDTLHSRYPPALDRSSECNSTATGGAAKKAKVQASSSTQSTTFKVRKEKLGDRVTALHQLVSPFGKTDTASVLLEAIGYIRFLQSQIEALSLPYLNNGAGNKRQPHPVPIQGDRKCIFPEDPGQLLNDNCLKRKGSPDQESIEEPKDLRSRGLCLVPVSCTLHVGSDNGADYWAPALGGGFR